MLKQDGRRYVGLFGDGWMVGGCNVRFGRALGMIGGY